MVLLIKLFNGFIKISFILESVNIMENDLFISNVLVEGCDSKQEETESALSDKLSEHVNLLFAKSDFLATDKTISECIVDALYSVKNDNKKLALKYQDLIEDLTISEAAYVLIKETGAPNLANRLFGVISRKTTALMCSEKYNDLRLAILKEISDFNIGFSFLKLITKNS